MKWKVALVYSNFYEKEAAEYSAVVMGCILGKRKEFKMKTKSHGELLSDSRTKP